MELTVHQLSTSSPMELDLQFLYQLGQLPIALAIHVSTRSELLALKCSSIQYQSLPEMLWEWGLKVHLCLLVCNTKQQTETVD